MKEKLKKDKGAYTKTPKLHYFDGEQSLCGVKRPKDTTVFPSREVPLEDRCIKCDHLLRMK